MKMPGHSTEKLNMIMSFWYVIILAAGVRTQQVVTDLNLTPAVLNNLNSNAVLTSNPALVPAATFSPYSPYTPANSAADESDPPQGRLCILRFRRIIYRYCDWNYYWMCNICFCRHSIVSME